MSDPFRPNPAPTPIPSMKSAPGTAGHLSMQVVEREIDEAEIPANAERRLFIVQNRSTSPLFFKFGSGASAADYDHVLEAGAAANDGKGGRFSIENYDGALSFYSGAALAYSYVGFK